VSPVFLSIINTVSIWRPVAGETPRPQHHTSGTECNHFYIIQWASLGSRATRPSSYAWRMPPSVRGVSWRLWGCSPPRRRRFCLHGLLLVWEICSATLWPGMVPHAVVIDPFGKPQHNCSKKPRLCASNSGQDRTTTAPSRHDYHSARQGYGAPESGMAQ